MSSKVTTLFVLLLFINLPLASALEISNVRAEEIADTTAVIAWETDELADSFVNIGKTPDTMELQGSALQTQEHRFPLFLLQPETQYSYTVRSGGVADEEIRTFTTLPPDVTPPNISLSLPEFVQGARIDIEGTTEAGAEIRLLVNSQPAGQSTTEGSFLFSGVILEGDRINRIEVVAMDKAGNSKSVAGNVFADITPPRIEVEPLPEVTEQSEMVVKGTVSENSTLEILVNERSVLTTSGMLIDSPVRLDEGRNTITIVALDRAGWETRKEILLDSDTQPPRVQMNLVNGRHFFEGRATTDITGETEPEAIVYLYIYRSRVDDYRADFDRAIAKTTADGNGSFVFPEQTFPPPPFSTLERLAPRQVPAGLEEILISPLSQIGDDQRKTFKVYVIAEDKTGKTGFAQETVEVSSCSSGDFAFDINPLIEFQTPLRLKPNLMEEGREAIGIVFNMSYRGSAVVLPQAPSLYQTGNQLPYQINTVRFEKACTRNQVEDEDYKLGCQLLPSQFTVHPNQGKTAFFVSANLQRAADFVTKEDDPWKDFVDKRRLKFPVKATIRYQERELNGALGQSKTQVFCQDLNYFVDVPIESEDLVPDVLVDVGLPAINATINSIEQIKPYLETVMMVTGGFCVGSLLTKMVVRLYRNFISGFEYWLTRAKRDEGGDCPLPTAQRELYLEETIKGWSGIETVPGANIPPDAVKKSLKARCPQTAKAWEIEEFFDKAYKWSCDRFLCRSVPARWTEGKEKKDVDAVIVKQQQCAVTSTGIPLIKVENCQDILKENPANRDVLVVENKGRPFTCWQLADQNDYYYRVDNPDRERSSRIWTLRRASSQFGGPLGQVAKPDLLAYLPPGSDTPIVGVKLSCDNWCTEKQGYQATEDGYTINGGAGCYKQTGEGSQAKLKGNGDSIIDGVTKIQAGYTEDCFINEKDRNDPNLYQCVCQQKKKLEPSRIGAREAIAKQGDGKTEPWSYRQATLYAESGKTAGTYYPEWRYYDGRDFSGAFGLNYIMDIHKDSSDTEFASTTVDPHTQTVSTFQSMCLPGIYARLNMLESTLIGFQKCIVEAKYTGLHDAGFCKTLFSQYVCGMVYKGIAYLGGQCSPLSFKDIGKGEAGGTVEGVQAFLTAGAQAIPQTLETSIQEVRSDYGNAHLENFFAAGSQGFAESMCLAAFGYDFPMGMDFIQDLAYSFSTSVDVIFPVAERELASFDPVKGSAVYDYTLGGVVFPGCSIRAYKTELKCITKEDLGNPNIDCSNGQCDCLQSNMPEFAGERNYLVSSGTSIGGVTKGQMLDLPIESPQRVSSNYRYDHVVFSVTLDVGEKPEACFPEGYRSGIFYFPIRDVDASRAVQCQVHPGSGRFVCSTIAALFGQGSPYFEYPFMECLDKRSNTYVPCDTPNILLLGDEIVVKPHITMGTQKACLRVKDSNDDVLYSAPLPEGQVGPHSPTVPLGRVTPDMIGGTSVGTIVKNQGTSDPGCGANSGETEPVSWPTAGQQVQTGTFRFTYTIVNGRYQLQVPAGLTVDPTYRLDPTRKYNIDTNRFLTLETGGVAQRDVTAAEANEAVFSSNGFSFKSVLGYPTPRTPPTGVCEYQIVPPRGGGLASKQGALYITAELLEPGPGDSCYTASAQVPAGQRGAPAHRQTITVQAEPIETQIAADLDEDFKVGNYNRVMAKAQGVINRKEATVEEAVALFYLVGSYLMVDPSLGTYKGEVSSLLRLFFTRDYNGEIIPDYSPPVQQSGEYQKVKQYLCQIDLSRNNGAHQNKCTVAVPASLCSSTYDKDIGDGYKYQCLGRGKAQGCRISDGKTFPQFAISTITNRQHKTALTTACP